MSDPFANPWTVVHQASLSLRFPRQAYWSVLPFPTPGDVSNPGIELIYPAWAGGFFTHKPPGKPINSRHSISLLNYIAQYMISPIILYPEDVKNLGHEQQKASRAPVSLTGHSLFSPKPCLINSI